MKTRLLIAVGSLVFALGCDAVDATPGSQDSPEPAVQIEDIPVEDWNALAGRRVFFGHQSVGRNIVDGLRRVLADNPRIDLEIVPADEFDGARTAGFIDASIGRNREPHTKDAAFIRAVQDLSIDSGSGGIAMYKYCYVDMQPGTDPDSLLAAYAATIDTVRARHPDLTIVHVTMPLTAVPRGLRERVATRLGRSTETAANARRNRYNEMLRRRFPNDPIFDLARIQSTRADGTRSFVTYRRRPVYVLAPEWTDDGGHLVPEARYAVAERLLVFLATVVGERVGAPSSAESSAT